MSFAHPHVLWLLLVFPPAMLLFFYWSWRQRQLLMAKFIQARLLPALTVGISPGRQQFRLACLILAVVAALLALARPQWGFDWEEARLKGLDIVVALDTSKSMLAEDISPNRLGRAKLAALDLMQQAKSDRLGLIAFAGEAFLQCPLTIDDTAFRQSVESLDVNTIPQGGTALAEAIDTALTAFKEGDNYKVLVLFSDGEDHDSGALEAAKRAAEAGLRIYTVGIGTTEGELIRIKGENGQNDFVRDEQQNVVKSHLNEELLRQIASATEGGFYLPLRGAKTVDTLYEQGLAKLPKSQRQEKLIKRFHERFHWPLAAAIVLLLVEMLFPERKPEPRARRHTNALAPAAAAALLLAGFGAPELAWGSPASALREYKAGKYEQAQKQYEELLRKKADDPRLHFNAGASAYRNGQLDAAAKQFNEALNTPDLGLQQSAYFNRGNTLYYLGEQAPDPAKRNEAWKKSLQDFESSLKLNPKDPDAKFNREYVKQRLEELQQQQQQQDKSDQKQDQNQDQNQQQQQQQQNQQNQQQQEQQSKQEQNQQQQSGQKQDQQQQAQQQQNEEKQQQQAQAQQAEDKNEKKQAQAAQAKDKDKTDEKEQGSAAAPGQMTPKEAQQLLDAQKGDEAMLPIQQKRKPSDPSKPVRDW